MGISTEGCMFSGRFYTVKEQHQKDEFNLLAAAFRTANFKFSRSAKDCNLSFNKDCDVTNQHFVSHAQRQIKESAVVLILISLLQDNWVRNVFQSI